MRNFSLKEGVVLPAGDSNRRAQRGKHGRPSPLGNFIPLEADFPLWERAHCGDQALASARKLRLRQHAALDPPLKSNAADPSSSITRRCKSNQTLKTVDPPPVRLKVVAREVPSSRGQGHAEDGRRET